MEGEICEHFEQVPVQVIRKLVKDMKESKYRLRKAKQAAEDDSSTSGGPSPQGGSPSGLQTTTPEATGDESGDSKQASGQSSPDPDAGQSSPDPIATAIQEYLEIDPW